MVLFFSSFFITGNTVYRYGTDKTVWGSGNDSFYQHIFLEIASYYQKVGQKRKNHSQRIFKSVGIYDRRFFVHVFFGFDFVFCAVGMDDYESFGCKLQQKKG